MTYYLSTGQQFSYLWENLLCWTNWSREASVRALTMLDPLSQGTITHVLNILSNCHKALDVLSSNFKSIQLPVCEYVNVYVNHQKARHGRLHAVKSLCQPVCCNTDRLWSIIIWKHLLFPPLFASLWSHKFRHSQYNIPSTQCHIPWLQWIEKANKVNIINYQEGW